MRSIRFDPRTIHDFSDLNNVYNQNGFILMRFFLRISPITRLFALLLTASMLFVAAATAGAAEQMVRPEQLRQFLDDYIEQQRDILPPAEIRFKELRLPDPFAVPAGKLTCEVTPSDPRILPSRRFNLILRVDGEVVENLAVSGTLEALTEVAVAAKDLHRGAPIQAADIQMETRDLNDLRSPCFDSTELIGKQLKRSLRAGHAFERASVEFPPLVKRGEMVTMTARRGALTITTRGLAQQNGGEGDVIRVRNISSNKDILCKVTGPESVLVEF
jgi:flagella basal body P-ring formation protein FlgA